MPTLKVEVKTNEHRIYTIGKPHNVNSVAFKFVEKTVAGKKRMFFEYTKDGVVKEIDLGDSKIPPSID